MTEGLNGKDNKQSLVEGDYILGQAGASGFASPDNVFEGVEQAHEANSGIAGSLLKKASNFLLTENGIDINRVSIAARAGGELLFTKADTDKDGIVTQMEMVRGAESDGLSDRYIQKMLSEFPKDGIKKGELTGTLTKLDQKMAQLDTDKNGYLDGDEIKVPFDQKIADNFSKLSAEIKSEEGKRAIAENIPAQGIEAYTEKFTRILPNDLRTLDDNKDNAISLNEIREHLKSNGMGSIAETLDVKKGRDGQFEPPIKELMLEMERSPLGK